MNHELAVVTSQPYAPLPMVFSQSAKVLHAPRVAHGRGRQGARDGPKDLADQEAAGASHGPPHLDNIALCCNDPPH